MNTPLFESFCEMLDRLPARAIIPAVKVQRRMLEEDLTQNRTALNQNSASVLIFCYFLADDTGRTASFGDLPIGHCAFYGRIIERLIEAGELPYVAKERFDVAFSTAMMKALTSPD